MPSYLEAENVEAVEPEETAQTEVSHEAENISTANDDKARGISPNSKCKIETVTSAGSDTISIEAESSLSRATVVALGGEEAATEFVDSFAASFVEKYSAEFQKQLEDMKEIKVASLKESGVAGAINENATEEKHREELSTETKPFVSPPVDLVVSQRNSEQIPQKPSLESGRKVEPEPIIVEEPQVRAGGRRRQNSRRVRTRRRNSSSNTSQTSTRSSSGSSSSSGPARRRLDDVTSEYDTKEASVEDMKVQVWKIDDIFDEASYERVFVAYDPLRRPTAKDEELSSEKYSKWILVLRRVFENDNKSLRKTKLDIQSPLILEILQDIVKEEEATLVSKKSVAWPNDNIFRYRQKIEVAAAEKGELAVKHVEALSELINTEYATRIKDIDDMFEKGTSSFEILREAFWPGDIAVKGTSDNPQAFRITAASYYVQPSFSGGPDEVTLVISAEYIDFSGLEFGTVSQTFRIKQYSGIKYIKELEVFPLKYHPTKEEVEKTLFSRGQKFAALKERKHKVYNGPVDRVEVYCRKPGRYDSLTPSDEPMEISSEIVIDVITFNRFSPPHECIVVSSIGDELVHGELTNAHLMICTDRVPFFSLQDKKFHKGNIANIEDKVFNENVFSQLVLPESTKELVRVLVRNHKKGRDFDDFVKGKGKGLVLLLHGPPGVGKTMTAEAVAEYSHRPLYVVTCGELGTTPEAVEASLERVLDISNSFGAVLLLDEADIFLEQRTASDLQRNALVSIFLRLLEYYKGILFLTTNRIRTFDDAFHSRIHITLGYSNHDAVAREQIWRNFGTYMASGLDIDDKDYAELATWELNGRQIKNVLSSCKALAGDRGERINMKDLRTVLEISALSGSEKLGQQQS